MTKSGANCKENITVLFHLSDSYYKLIKSIFKYSFFFVKHQIDTKNYGYALFPEPNNHLLELNFVLDLNLQTYVQFIHRPK